MDLASFLPILATTFLPLPTLRLLFSEEETESLGKRPLPFSHLQGSPHPFPVQREDHLSSLEIEAPSPEPQVHPLKSKQNLLVSSLNNFKKRTSYLLFYLKTKTLYLLFCQALYVYYLN